MEATLEEKQPVVKERPKVYVTQVPNRRDKETGIFVPTVNIAPASEHGDVQVMMPPNASFYASADLLRQLRQGLRDYTFARGDCIVALGDPAIILAVGSVLAEMRTRYRVLKWDRVVSRYMPVEIDLRPEN